MFALDTLCKSVRSPSTVEVEPPLDHDAIALLASAPKPAHGTVSWQLPPSYRSFLTEMGRFSLGWFSPTLGKQHWIVLFDADGIVDASEIVYVPGGVDMGSGAISTNHLVPFAGEPGGEWAFCFDSAAPGPEYPVYYHHQDQPRARLVAS